MFCILPVVRDIAEGNIVYASARSLAIFVIEADLQVDELTLAEILDTDILEQDIPHEDVVSAIDGHTSLIINLFFAMVKNVDVFVNKILDDFIPGYVTVEPDHYRMCHIGPEGGVLHCDIAASALVPKPCCIDSGAIV